MWKADGAGIAGLIRDHLGKVRLLFTVALAHLYSPKHAETIAIWEGLRQGRRFGYTNCTLENDCKGVIDQLLARSGTLVSLGHIHQ